jgi:hypothetical protein
MLIYNIAYLEGYDLEVAGFKTVNADSTGMVFFFD